MKKLTTILKQINELYSSYTDKDILEGFNKLDKQKYFYSTTSYRN